MAASVLIADDSEGARKVIHKLLGDAGFNVSEAVDGLDALKKIAQLRPDLIVLDVRMPNMNGIEVASIVKEQFPKIKIILLSMYEIGPMLTSAVGISAVIPKQEGIDRVPDCVRELLA
jgi:CheY-like chemotaxis protein